ncbi:MAG: excinuclease ABC subunit UvrA [Deltaproteobacteria bacterium]|nr:excinuclease ABC subunit UvrA [Deltaproteobacteria bacterium]
MDKLILTDIAENNLKHISVELDHNSLIVVSGLSGSGKSSLVFDTIYAEGGRRYVETFSPYTRQFLEKFKRPNLASAKGIRPALILRQHNQVHSSRSTVGTLTEINEYLKAIWAYAALPYCPKCHKALYSHTPKEFLSNFIGKISSLDVKEVIVTNSLDKIPNHSECSDLLKLGYFRYFEQQTQTIKEIEGQHSISSVTLPLHIIVDRIKWSKERLDVLEQRLLADIQQLTTGNDKNIIAWALFQDGASPLSHAYHCSSYCSKCSIQIPPATPNIFSFNTPLGACHQCSGFGKTLTIDLNLCIPDPTRTIKEGAIACWKTPSTSWEFEQLLSFCKKEKIPTTMPWHELSKKQQELIFTGKTTSDYLSISGWFEYLHRKRHKLHVRVFLSRYRRETTCPSCHGTRLQAYAGYYKLNGYTMHQAWNMPVRELLSLLSAVQHDHKWELLKNATAEAVSRLSYLVDIGLDYLTLDRQTKTLSGGEAQRVNLTAIIGSRLTNTITVLDEPTIGLHPADTTKLISTCRAITNHNNTVVIVEHDQDIIRAADHVLDLGPRSGERGGEIVFSGRPGELVKCENSLTAKYLRQSVSDKHIRHDFTAAKKLQIKGAKVNNLKNITVEIPLNFLVVITGISGSGKSSLIKEVLYKNYLAQKGKKQDVSSYASIVGAEQLHDIVLIDQMPLLKSPRSNPATYTKVWDEIRALFAATPEATEQGFSRSAFSFNVVGGRCPICEGSGYKKIDLQFLADAYVLCDACQGLRFQDSVLKIKYQGMSISDFLNMTLEDIRTFFSQTGNNKQISAINAKMASLLDLGLGYLKLGQPLSQLSGGEAQRVKLASYLNESNKKPSLFLLDEPSTGLHPHNIADLFKVLNLFIEHGHSICCIEHNLDIISKADWMIDLGPEAGEAGGQIVCQGAPLELIKDTKLLQTSKTVACLKSYCQQSAESNLPVVDNKSNQLTQLQIRGARQNNLKNINLDIPLNQYTVITGVSGSGKSSLAFDTIFAEGQKRFIDCLSPYARHFLTQIKPTEVDFLDGLAPTVALSQKTVISQSLSTVATLCEIYPYLRLLYARAGVLHCPEHDLPMQHYSVEEIISEISKLDAQRIFIYAPVVTARKGNYRELLARALNAELSEAIIDGQLESINEDMSLKRHQQHTISLLVAAVNNQQVNRSLLVSALSQALALSGSTIEVRLNSKLGKLIVYNTETVCPKCKQGFRDLTPYDFSFSSKIGACESCDGSGYLEKRNKTELCPDCRGSRLGKIGRSTYFERKTIFALTQMTAPELLKFFNNLKWSTDKLAIFSPIINEVKHRLQVLTDVGLSYLELSRAGNSISGGEAQRLRLGRALGSPLSGVCYVLDEPSIGLHAQDNKLLLSIIDNLKKQGNSVIVVEHEESLIRGADYLVDMGPGGGKDGGQIVAQGKLEEVLKSKNSATAKFLKEDKIISAPHKETTKSSPRLILPTCSANNLKNIKVEFPTAALTVVCGVSGSGKSSLVFQTLLPRVLENVKNKKRKKEDEFPMELQGIENCLQISQASLGRSASSTPASYLGLLNEIRNFFAILPQAEMNGLTPSYFSHNTKHGRCAKCGGRGYISVPLGFLPEAQTTCEECNGLRYNGTALQVKYQNLSIGDILKLTVDEASDIFTTHRKISRILKAVKELGLGYLVLGQPSYTLSGGEAQRLKIAYELVHYTSSKNIYLLDEPTIGLHFKDIFLLLGSLRNLINDGHTVVVVEHNLDFIVNADYLIELGPEAGQKGGKVLFQGTVYDLLKQKITTPTKSALLEANYTVHKKV